MDAGGTFLDLTFARRRTNDNQDNLTTFIFFAERTRDNWAGWQSSSLFFFYVQSLRAYHFYTYANDNAIKDCACAEPISSAAMQSELHVGQKEKLSE